MNRVFICSFVDELEKISGYAEALAASGKRIDRAHAAAQEAHWANVMKRIQAALERRFPPSSAKPKIIRGPLAKVGSFQDLVHHPLVQAIGYGALAGEGLHAMAQMPSMQKRLPGVYGFAHKSTAGRLGGAASLALATAFLGAEGLAALTGWKKRSHEPKIKALLSK